MSCLKEFIAINLQTLAWDVLIFDAEHSCQWMSKCMHTLVSCTRATWSHCAKFHWVETREDALGLNPGLSAVGSEIKKTRNDDYINTQIKLHLQSVILGFLALSHLPALFNLSHPPFLHPFHLPSSVHLYFSHFSSLFSLFTFAKIDWFIACASVFLMPGGRSSMMVCVCRQHIVKAQVHWNVLLIWRRCPPTNEKALDIERPKQNQ